MLIIQIVPKLPPAIDGLGDYALNLARQFRKDFGIETHFIVGNPTWTGAKQIEEFPVSKVNDHSADNLLSLLTNNRISTVLLHYVGYGYAKRGCPNWLVDGLQRWRTESTHRKLVTMFHEVYADGRPPWTSSFWLSSLQKKLASRLVQLSDRALTSKQLYAEILHKLSQGKHQQIPTIPVFSNIGEPQQVLPLVKRQRQLVVFGGRSKRLSVYQNCWSELKHVCQLLEIKQILDIGPAVELPLASTHNLEIAKKGELSTSEISNILLNSLVGFLDYNPLYLAKSGIFAAYCAHGLITINYRCSHLPIDGIEHGKHYLLSDEYDLIQDLEKLQIIASNAYSWYQRHRLSIQAEQFFSYLNM